MTSAYLPPEHDEVSRRLFVRNAADGNVSLAGSNLLVLRKGCGVFVDEWWESDRAFLRDVTARKLLEVGRLSLESVPR